MNTKNQEEMKRAILAELPRFMESDPEVRDFILRITRERFADKEETESRFDRIMSELQRDREIQEKKWGDQDKRWEENQNIIKGMLNSIKKLEQKHDVSIGALGAR